MNTPYIHLHPEDNVLVALTDLEAGTTLFFKGEDLKLNQTVPAKHKFLISGLNTGDALIMYGVIVARALESLSQGDLISVHNVSNAVASYTSGNMDYRWNAPDVKKWKDRTFEGYHRSDGRVGTSNYWLVLPLVFCENRNVEALKTALTESLGYPSDQELAFDIHSLVQAYKAGASTEQILDARIFRSPYDPSKEQVFRNVDGIKFLTHEGGCGGTREDSKTLGALLAGYITNPNVAGATVLSLGCQHLQLPHLEKLIRDIDPAFSKPLVLLEQQGSESEEDFMEEALKKTFVGLTEANNIQRTPAPLSKLTLGLECGASDGFSGISANPTLGYVSDLLVALGGKVILSEFPELNGVEQDLLNRCREKRLAEKFASLMDSYGERARALGSGFTKNPSPGNIKEGLITNAMKSAGAARKGGTSPVTDVLEYTEQSTQAGLNLLCTPGNDVESTTGLAASGANVIVFTTGLGTPTGNPVCPVIKVSSNSPLYEQMKDLIDFDTGSIILGKSSIRGLGEELLEHIIEVASGLQVPAAVRLHQNDFIPWKRGISL
jgi:altronate hydrolase